MLVCTLLAMPSDDIRDAARLLLVEADALRPILESAAEADFDNDTVCTGWSVRDVLSHCGAALTMVARGETHAFTPEDNERDVNFRRTWPIAEVLDELFAGYEQGAAAIDAAGGPLDGVGLGEWMHGGDVREALGAADPYASAGSDLAFGLLLERSAALGKPLIDVAIDGTRHTFGSGPPPAASLETDLETFVRLCGGRRPDPDRYTLVGAEPAELVLFS